MRPRSLHARIILGTIKQHSIEMLRMILNNTENVALKILVESELRRRRILYKKEQRKLWKKEENIRKALKDRRE